MDAEKLLTSEINVPYNDFINPATLLEINENVLMCQTGYLTLKTSINKNRSTIGLGIANREVATALSSLLSLRIFDRNIDIINEHDENLLEIYSTDRIIELFNSQLAAIAYDRYPVKEESMLRALLQLYLKGKGADVRCEQHNFKGRSDLIINLKTRRIVIELKFSNNGTSIEKLLQKAVEQLKEQEYGTEDADSREVIKVACVFSAADCDRRIVAYQQV